MADFAQMLKEYVDSETKDDGPLGLHVLIKFFEKLAVEYPNGLPTGTQEVNVVEEPKKEEEEEEEDGEEEEEEEERFENSLNEEEEAALAANHMATSDILRERDIRDAFFKIARKREDKLNAIAGLPVLDEQKLNIKNTLLLVEIIKRQFKDVANLSPIITRALEMANFTHILRLLRVAKRFNARTDEIKERNERENVPIGDEFAGWTQIGDEDGRVYYVNEEGLLRFDVPQEWIEEEFEQERRTAENMQEIANTEAFAIERVDVLLDKIAAECKECFRMYRDIRTQVADKGERKDARDLVTVIKAISKEILDWFDYTAAAPVMPVNIPQFGVTNASIQRRDRYRADWEDELEAYFDEDSQDENE